MRMGSTIPSSTSPRPADARSLALAVVVCAGVFFVVNHDTSVSLREYFSYSMNETETLLETSHWQRPLGFSTFAAFGVYCLLQKGRRSVTFRSPLAISLLALVAWCMASVVWADDPGLTLKRVGILVFSLIGAAGLASRFSPRQLCILTIVVLSTFCSIGLMVEFAYHTFCPWRSGYQFAGTLHPNLQAVHCAILCLAIVCVTTDNTTPKRSRYVAGGILAAVLLLLTRSRTGIASLIPGFAVVLLPRVPRRFRLLAGVGFVWAFFMLLWLGTIADVPVAKRLTNAALMGRGGSTSTLQGRIPLWSTLADYVWQRPVIGHGFDGFWDVARIRAVARYVDWAPSSAHSLYIETVLGIGLVGALLLFLTMMQTIFALGRQYLNTNDSGTAFLFGLLVYAVFEGMLESLFVEPMFVTAVAITAVVQTALFPTRSGEP